MKLSTNTEVSHYECPFIQAVCRGGCPFIEKEAGKFITLPLHADLTDEEVDYVIEHLKSFPG